MQRALALSIAALFSASALATAVPGQLAPAFNVTDLSGKPVKLEDYKGKTIVLEWTNFVNPTVRDQVTFGVLHRQIRGQETFFGLGFPLTISDGHRSASAAYAQIDHRLAGGVKLIGGFQANKMEGLGLDVVPRGGVIWSPAPRWNVKALYGQAFRAPSINETSLNHPGLQGNPSMRPENVATFDLELSYHGEHAHGSENPPPVEAHPGAGRADAGRKHLRQA